MIIIEEIVYEYLDATMDVPVYMTRPETVSGQYVLVEKTGGDESNKIRMSTFAFQSYGDTLLEAIRLNEVVKAAVEDLIASPEITGIHFNTDYNFTNTADKRPRYQATFDIYHY